MTENESPTPNLADEETIAIAQTELVALLERLDEAQALARKYRDELQTVLDCLGKLAPLASGGAKGLLSLATNPSKFADIKTAIQRDLAPILQRYATEDESPADGRG